MNGEAGCICLIGGVIIHKPVLKLGLGRFWLFPAPNEKLLLLPIQLQKITPVEKYTIALKQLSIVDDRESHAIKSCTVTTENVVLNPSMYFQISNLSE